MLLSSKNNYLKACIFIVCILVGCGFDRSKKRSGHVQNLNLNEPILERWIVKSLSIPDNQFVPIDAIADTLTEYQEQSRGNLSLFLKEEIDPYRGGKSGKWYAHVAEPGGIDLLRSDYQVAGLQLSIREGQNFVVLKAVSNTENLSAVNNKGDYITRLIERIVKTETVGHKWKFEIPNDINSSWQQRLITNKGASSIKELESRHDRADILLWNDALYFIFYKKIDQLEDFLPDDKWFNAEARAAIQRRLKRP
jgi:hypothetical protein